MKQVIQFKSPKEHYRADGCVFWCFDRRFKELCDAFVEYLGLRCEDLVQVAGGAMELRSRDGEAYKYLLGQALKSWKLHGADNFYLTIHADCGAYKAAGLIPDGASESEFLEQELINIRNNFEQDLRDAGCGSKILTYLVDFDGLREVE